ncbi:hypothetical protein P5673_026829 [Acropora cervicornis]|uniref:C-type lectin domain-containing protein n=1 Tax=Acropora cervicornis TaxID=6130 RepID=A0AAD9Q055_ACRCE|nr:hypothetical protein P5673_026829 [Acropora cervicornis]
MADKCSDGWKNLNDSCYFFADYAQASFSETGEVCGDLDAQLIVIYIYSLEEYDFLHNSLKGKIIWLGIRRRLDLPSSRRQLNGNKVNFNEVSENEAHRFVANHYSHCGSRKDYICVEAHWREWHLVMCSYNEHPSLRSNKNGTLLNCNNVSMSLVLSGDGNLVGKNKTLSIFAKKFKLDN